MSQTPLFAAGDLADWLHQPVSGEAAVATERVVWGWLRPLLKLDERPANPSDELISWATELGGIAYVNPEGLASYALESEKSDYSSERRDEILRTAAGGGVTAPGAAVSPRGSFPSAYCYPDPATPWGW